jgi:hypothetical protein
VGDRLTVWADEVGAAINQEKLTTARAQRNLMFIPAPDTHRFKL